MWENPKRVEATIKRLSREIEQMDELFYPEDTEERHLYAGMLERKRDDLVRGFVIQIHTAIETFSTSSSLLLLQEARAVIAVYAVNRPRRCTAF